VAPRTARRSEPTGQREAQKQRAFWLKYSAGQCSPVEQARRSANNPVPKKRRPACRSKNSLAPFTPSRRGRLSNSQLRAAQGCGSVGNGERGRCLEGHGVTKQSKRRLPR